ncbi:MAG: helix-turn-helix transcriptional regulator [Propionibacteriaceae bacterium]|nr:helix-turn-helix transcriptional regulator [Propionibacteriaceae bacterium]
MTATAKPLAQVIGENVRRLRGTFTMEQLATEGRAYGLNWSVGSIGAIEKGTFKPTIETLAILCHALGSLGLREGKGNPTPKLTDLLESSSPIELSGILWTETSALTRWLAGEELDSWVSPPAFEEMQARANREVDRVKALDLPPGWVIDTGHFGHPTPGEIRLAARAGIDPLELQAWANRLWNKPIEEHRDVVAGASATAQKRGRVSRVLLDELTKAMKGTRVDD